MKTNFSLLFYMCTFQGKWFFPNFVPNPITNKTKQFPEDFTKYMSYFI